MLFYYLRLAILHFPTHFVKVINTDHQNIKLKNIFEISLCKTSHLLHLITVFMKTRRIELSYEALHGWRVCPTASNGAKLLSSASNTMHVPAKSLPTSSCSFTMPDLVFLPSFILFYSI